MIKLNDLPVKRKFFLITLTSTSVALLVTTISIIFIDLHNYQRNLVAETTGIADIISFNLAPAIAFNDPVTANEILRSLRADVRIEVANIYLQGEAKPFAGYPGIDNSSPSSRLAHLTASRFIATGQCNESSFIDDHLGLCRTITLDNEMLGILVISLGLENYYEQLNTGAILIVVVALLGLLLAYYITRRLSIHITKPIHNLTTLATIITEKEDYTIRAEKYGRDETGTLTDAFNSMLTEINKREIALKQHQNELERIVNERTVKLTTTVGELEIARDTAENANREKSKFLSRMSHELRTPMNAILGFAQLLELREIDKDYSVCVEHILSAGNHLLQLIDEVLDLARIESGKFEVSCESVPMKSVIEDCLDLIVPLAKTNKISIIDNASDCGTSVTADYMRLKQVILNLLSNAVKYNLKGGTVTINQNNTDDQKIRLSIEDTGPGLTDEQIGNLFNPFERFGAEFTEVKGTGIGLVISKQLINLMGGKIGVESVPGKGCTFWISLPEHAGKDTDIVDASLTTEQDEPVVEQLNGKKILYIEDNAANLKLMRYFIDRTTGYCLLEENNPASGIARAVQDSPEMILLDIHLPGMDGYEVLKKLRMDERTKNIPVIAITANAMLDDIEKAKASGFDHFITKPVSFPLIKEALQRFL